VIWTRIGASFTASQFSRWELLQEMGETTCHGRIESIYFGSHTGYECDTELDVGGKVAGFVGCGRGGLGFRAILAS
jgi:hypothetical protein